MPEEKPNESQTNYKKNVSELNFTKEEIVDRVKILEFSNSIDEWEKEVLFSVNGFYSIKGKEVENKYKDFYEELMKFINSQVKNVIFKNQASILLLSNIKKAKIEEITSKMKLYVQSQIDVWMEETYDKALKSAVEMAKLNKENPDKINAYYNNGISVLREIRIHNNLNERTFLNKKLNFDSFFYEELINSFIEERDIKASYYFEKYGERILDEEKRIKTAKYIKELRNNIVAIEYANELILYNLTDKEKEKEIDKVADKEINLLIRKNLTEYEREQKKKKELQEKISNEEAWSKIKYTMENNPRKAVLDIDFSLSDKHKSAMMHYIKTIKEKGYIKTDADKFFELLKEIREDFKTFQNKDISDLNAYLSIEDYLLVQELLNQSTEEYDLFKSDYDYLVKEFKKNKINDKDVIYSCVKIVWNSYNSILKPAKKFNDISARTEIINNVVERLKM